MRKDIIKKVDKKEVKLGVHWKNYWINFCTLNFTSDNSFIFSSKFHNQDGDLEFGKSKLSKSAFSHLTKTHNYKINKGCHISLHPKGQIMHFRQSYPGKILFERKIKWFPVRKSFNLLYLYSLPLDLCAKSNKSTPFFTPIPDRYANSIQVKVDIFPKDTKKHFPYRNSIWIFWGYCPEYLVRVSFNLIKQRTPAFIFWPADEKLVL